MAVTTLTMADSTTVADLPATGFDAYAGYVGGSWPTWNALKKRFPLSPLLSVAVNSHEDAQCLDVEKGDATPADVPTWLDRQHSLRPTETQIIYCPASQTAAVRTAAGARKYLLISAHYGVGAHICGPGFCKYPQADWTQWDDHGPKGEHYDRSLLSPAVLNAISPAKKPNPVVDIIHKIVIVIRRPFVRHNTGLATEKPWGAFPLKSGWYGVDDKTPNSHSGGPKASAADQRAIKQIQREVGAKDDGDFGFVTRGKVVTFQIANHLLGDGKVGTRTWAEMTIK